MICYYRFLILSFLINIAMVAVVIIHVVRITFKLFKFFLFFLNIIRIIFNFKVYHVLLLCIYFYYLLIYEGNWGIKLFFLSLKVFPTYFHNQSNLLLDIFFSKLLIIIISCSLRYHKDQNFHAYHFHRSQYILRDKFLLHENLLNLHLHLYVLSLKVLNHFNLLEQLEGFFHFQLNDLLQMLMNEESFQVKLNQMFYFDKFIFFMSFFMHFYLSQYVKSLPKFSFFLYNFNGDC